MKTLQDRFNNKWGKNSDTGCWEWTAYKNNTGYGRINVGGVMELSHRVSYQLHRGPLHGMHVLHKCDVPACVNPDHLFLGTHQDNMKDMVSKGRQVSHIGEAHGRAKLTEAQAREIFQAKGSQQEIGSRYGVTGMQVGTIKRKETWKHIHAD